MEQTRQLAAIMFTDMVGYTALMGLDEQKAMGLLKVNREIHKSTIVEFNGKWLKEMGDGTLVSFPSATEAVYCAIKIQNRAKEIDALNLRIGIHVGEIIVDQGDVFGDGVNIASRIESLASSGAIWISDSVVSNIRNKKGIETRFIKEERLKNVVEPVRIYEVKVPGDSEVLIGSTSSLEKLGYLRQIGIISGIILIALFLLYLYYPFHVVDETPDQPITIAVLAFEDQSPEGNQEYLGDGVAGEIINLLTKVKGLSVVGKASSFSFKKKNATIDEIGVALSAGVIVDGSVNVVEGITRINVQLNDVVSGSIIWSDHFDLTEVNIISIIDGSAQSIASALISELSVNEVEEITMTYKPSAEAYKYFLMAEHVHFNKSYNGSGSFEDRFEKSKALYQRAISVDPGYAVAYAGLANLYDTRGNTLLSMEADHPKRDSILNISYKIDPESPYVLFMKGFVSHDDDSTFFFLEKAYEINPFAEGSVLLINKLVRLGMYDLSISLCKKYLAIDPLSNVHQGFLVGCLWKSGRISELKEQIRRIREFDEENLLANRWLLEISIFVDHDTIAARKLLRKMGHIGYNQARLLVIEGRTEEALEVNLDRYQDLGLRLMVNMKPEALAMIKQNIGKLDNPVSDLFEYESLHGNPIFANVRSEPQFQVWLKEAKVVYDERMLKYGHLFK